MTTLHFILVAAAFLCLALAGFGVGGKLQLPWLAAALLVLAYMLIPAGQALGA